jgi:hypothetical protein
MKIFIIGGVSVLESQAGFPQNRELLGRTMNILGRDLVKRGHDLLLCSPFENSADHEAIRGAAEAAAERKGAFAEFHLPASAKVADALSRLKQRLAPLHVATVTHPPPADENSKEAWNHAWLLAQLSAMEASNAVVAVGGKSSGPMSFLLPLAEARKKVLLPFRFLEGAAAGCFERQRYALADKLDEQINALSEPEGITRAADLLDRLTAERTGASRDGREPKFFISYAKARPKEADFVEMILRRRNLTVFRDDRDFAPGSAVQSEIDNHIEQADVFIALWCNEYACSPWCFDELEEALRRKAAGLITIWLIRVDETRIVPKGARDLLSYPVRSREELEGQIIKLLEQPESPRHGSQPMQINKAALS